MAGTNYWQGTTDNYDTDGNWTLIKPVVDDRVLIPETNKQAILVGLDNENTIDLNEIYVARGFAANIGSTGTPWYISADLLKFFGSGEFWYKVGDAATDRLEIQAAKPSTVVNLDNGTGVMTLAQLTRGTITVVGDITTAIVGYVTNRLTDAKVEFTSAAGTVTLLKQYGGTVTAANVLTTVDHVDGTFVRTGTTALTTLYNHGGTCYYDGTGTVTTAHVFGGVLDLNRTLAEKTITTCYLYPGGELKHDETIHTVNIIYVKEAA